MNFLKDFELIYGVSFLIIDSMSIKAWLRLSFILEWSSITSLLNVYSLLVYVRQPLFLLSRFIAFSIIAMGRSLKAKVCCI